MLTDDCKESNGRSAAVMVTWPKHRAAKFRQSTLLEYIGPNLEGVERTTAIRRRTELAPPELKTKSSMNY